VRRGDYTGQETARLQAQHADELAERQGRIGLVNEVPPEMADGLFDPYTGAPVEANGATERRLSDHAPVEEVSVNGDGQRKIMRVSSDIDDMTFGVGNTFSLKRGVRYRVSEDLYQWLDSKGLVL
jgi:hypothetical protein